MFVSDQEIAVECTQSCASTGTECEYECNGSTACIFDCELKLAECIDACPCNRDCPKGCVDCPSPFCTCRKPESDPDLIECRHQFESVYFDCSSYCQIGDFDCIGECTRQYDENMKLCPCGEECPNGCPCPVYDCKHQIKRSPILVLNSYAPENLPMVIDGWGNSDSRFNFVFGRDTEILHSCSVVWQNDLFIFGGNTQTRQISKMMGCGLIQISQLTFHHAYGDCTTVNDEIYLCFSTDTGKKCRVASSPLGLFHELPDSMYPHLYSRIAASDSKF